jgi:ABC-type multidrug transport system fused ATPase/permease subunit
MMEELDLLKKDWKKNENSYQQISENDIYKMLHKKSSSIVKWILIISVLEVCLWTSMSIIFNTDDYLKKMHSEYLMDYFKYLNLFNYVVIAIFIYMFYKNYKAISTITSTKQLMKDILNTRKTVKYYVWYNLGMLVVSMIIGFILAFTCNPKVQQVTSNGKVFVFTVLFCAVVLLVFVGLFWLFYRLLYGILLKKLFRNYNELKKIDF